MSRAVIAFIVSPLAASGYYWWFSLAEYIHRVGVPLAVPFSMLTMILVVAYAASLLLTVPCFLLLRGVGWASPISFCVAGTLIGGLVVSLAGTDKPWLHPEGFVAGLIAALTFSAVYGSNQALNATGHKAGPRVS